MEGLIGGASRSTPVVAKSLGKITRGKVVDELLSIGWMRKLGIHYSDTIIGTGTLATGDVWVRVRVRMFLNRGDEIKGLWEYDENGLCFRLKDREIFPGLRFAVDGMRVGGRREAKIGPHLAFGSEGIPGLIPPDALLRGEFDLLEVGDANVPLPSTPGPELGSDMSIRAWGEESSQLPRWRLIFHDRHSQYYPAQCSLNLEWSTRNDGKWGGRTAQHRSVEIPMTPDEIDWFIETGKRLPEEHASECLIDQVHTHGGYSPTRANADSAICWGISLVENGAYHQVCYIRESSPLWIDTAWGRAVMALVQPHLTLAPWRQQMNEQGP